MSNDERRQPKFQEQKNGDPGVVVSNKEKLIIDAAQKESGHVVGWFLDEETKLRKYVQVPRLPYQKFIDPAGNVVSMPIRTSRVARNPENPYQSWITSKKIKRGWVPYDELAPEERENLIAKRKAEHARNSAAFGTAFKSMEDRLVDGNRESLKSVMGELVAALKSNAPAPAETIKTKRPVPQGE